jgi:hypothetical protein
MRPASCPSSDLLTADPLPGKPIHAYVGTIVRSEQSAFARSLSCLPTQEAPAMESPPGLRLPAEWMPLASPPDGHISSAVLNINDLAQGRSDLTSCQSMGIATAVSIGHTGGDGQFPGQDEIAGRETIAELKADSLSASSLE